MWRLPLLPRRPGRRAGLGTRSVWLQQQVRGRAAHWGVECSGAHHADMVDVHVVMGVLSGVELSGVDYIGRVVCGMCGVCGVGWSKGFNRAMHSLLRGRVLRMLLARCA